MADDLTPINFFYSDGTITLVNGSDIAVGQFTGWATAVLPYDFLILGGNAGISILAEVIDDTHVRLCMPWSGGNLTAVSYSMLRWSKHTDPRIFGVRVSDYLTKLRQIPDDVAAFIVAINTAVATMNADAAATASDRAATAADRSAVASDKTATHTDRVAADAAAAAAATSAGSVNAGNLLHVDQALAEFSTPTQKAAARSNLAISDIVSISLSDLNALIETRATELAIIYG